ncbi:hypothetical protein [Idiomarina abyssalis]|uniref:hypothetical protein n=1 Tax=Idiomarina abyssalis TaxID=86102 RepID=UPI0006C8A1E2|nr:hypothetical protein [Idiomarina abyssalis]KPD21996.1 hypothetical protein ADS78_05970 [Idiomarina abyssalis]SFT64546.1 hypothetical protein SAMN04515657_1470 [Idiomarina abyssalis]
MKTSNIAIMCFLILFSAHSSANNDNEEYEGLSTHCRGVAAAITVTASLLPQTRAAQVAVAITGGVSEFMADEVMSKKCEKNLIEWSEYYSENPIDYDDFVRNNCNGNPLTCPGGGTWGIGQPQDCDYYITCLPGNPTLSGPFSVNDLIVTTSHFSNFWETNSWAVDKDGYPRYEDIIGSP